MIKEKEMNRKNVSELFNATIEMLALCEKRAKDPNEPKLVPIELTYKLLMNRDTLKPIVENMAKAVTFNGDAIKLQEFDGKRREIISRYSKKDENGNPVLINNNVEIEVANVNKANLDLSKLIDEYKETLEQKKSFDDEAEKFLSEQIKISVYFIDGSLLFDGIAPSQLSGLMPVLEGLDKLGY